MTTAGSGADAPWRDLHHAFGPAGDMADLMVALSQAHGHRLRARLTDFCERVLHQGTIYSASPPAVRQLIPIAAKARTSDRALCYEVLAEFAASARKAIHDGCAIACCAGGDPKHGSAILADLLSARDLFAPDLESSNAAVRRYAAALVCCSPEAGPEAARLVRNRYEIEKDPATRDALLDALVRVRDQVADWAEFLSAALERESSPKVRFQLRHEQIREQKSAADSTAAADLVSLFAAASATDYGADCTAFFEAVEWLGPDRQLTGLLEALAGSQNRDVVHPIARQLLRLVFHDGRSGWGTASYSTVLDAPARAVHDGYHSRGAMERSLGKAILKMIFLALLWKLFPFLLRRKLRHGRSQPHKIEYEQVAGEQPAMPPRLTADQARALAALAAKPEVWVDHTNLWSLFGLPDDAAGMRGFLTTRA
jgi:hypothetical protein